MPSVSRSPWRRRTAKYLREVAPLLLLLLARASLADHYWVPSGSMEPTLHVGDHVLVDKTAYGLRLPLSHTALKTQDPKRGDVIVFDAVDDHAVLIKRVVGVPGDRLAFDGERLWLNGQALDSQVDNLGQRSERLGDRLHPLAHGEAQGPPQTPLVIPEGQYFMMGDHRGNSQDSRSFGLVSRDRLLGRALLILYSPRPLPFWRRWGIPLTGADRRLWAAEDPEP